MRIPDYDNCLVNLSNSILKHFGLETYHPSIPSVDKMLEGNKQIVVFLFDGLGEAILNKHLDEDNYMRLNVRHRLSSVFPPTTVAATNAFLNAKYPLETDYLGWTEYFKEHPNQPIEVFTNRFKLDNTSSPLPGINSKHLACFNIIDTINAHALDKTRAHLLHCYPVDKKGPRLLSSFMKKAYKLAKQTENSFVYAYWTNPDHTLHHKGVDSKAAKRVVRKINRLFVRYTTKPKNQDVLTFAIADHGLIDVKPINLLKEHPEFEKMLAKPWAIETRAASFFIKDEYKQEFKKFFNEYYGDKFELYSKEQVLKNNIFGLGKPHPMVDLSLGDYLAVATSNYHLIFPDEEPFVAHHAGATDEEYTIDLIGVNGTLLKEDKERWLKEDKEKALLEAKARLHIEDQEVKVETIKDKNKNTPEDDQK